jgi:hypothetical protein
MTGDTCLKADGKPGYMQAGTIMGMMGECSDTLGDPCLAKQKGVSQPGKIAMNAHGEITCALDTPMYDGDECLLPGAGNGFFPAGVMVNSVCTDQAKDAVYDECMAASPVPELGLPDANRCLVIASSVKHPSVASGQPNGVAVEDKDSCASFFAFDLPLTSGLLHVCANKPAAPAGLIPGKPCNMPDGLDGWVQADGKCSVTPGQPCVDGNGAPGVMAKVLGSTEIACALLKPQQGDTCVVPGTSGDKSVAGETIGKACADTSVISSDFFKECLSIQADQSEIGTLNEDQCLIIASSIVHASTKQLPDQPDGSAVLSADLCTSKTAGKVQFKDGLVLVCVEPIQTVTPLGPPGSTCSVFGVAGTVSADGNTCLVAPARKTGDPCDVNGLPGKFDDQFQCVVEAVPVATPSGGHCSAVMPHYDSMLGLCITAPGETATGSNPTCDTVGHSWSPTLKACEEGNAAAGESVREKSSVLPWLIGIGLAVAAAVVVTKSMSKKGSDE